MADVEYTVGNLPRNDVDAAMRLIESLRAESGDVSDLIRMIVMSQDDPAELLRRMEAANA